MIGPGQNAAHYSCAAFYLALGRSGWTAASASGSDRVSETNRQNFSDLDFLRLEHARRSLRPPPGLDSGDIFIILKPGYIEWSSKQGTSHGTHYNYDTHVPLFFYGANISSKINYDKVCISDIAPTLSILMGVGFPNACTGNPIKGVLK